MKLYIGLIFIFLIFLYIYTFLKIHKKRKKNADKTASNLQFMKKKDSGYLKKESFSDKNSNYENYITKYNSPIDYIEKDQLFSDDNK